ncbi:glycoside hydrolase family 47 protein [Sphaerobolus stellatus SS14]|nr:glycoside hydrolase family 47 protein [Sphaerobolus stellatus SS14]
MATQQEHLRERRRQRDSPERERSNDRSDSLKQKQTSQSWSKSPLVYFIPFAVITFLIYRFPDVAKQAIEPWYEFEDLATSNDGVKHIVADIEKRDAVVAAFKHGWDAYEQDAFGDDEYHPISRTGSNLSDAGGIGYTVVDAIDTMILMGLHEEEKRAREWVANKLDFNRDGRFNTFETTIRVLGGLLSAYYLTKDNLYLDKAIDLGDRMMPAFDTPTGVPLSMVNLGRMEGVPDRDNNGLASTAEATTLQLEFRYLSHLTDNDAYWRAAEKVMAVIRKSRMSPALVPIFISPDMGQFVNSDIRLGSRGDSYYEYLLKQYLQTGRSEPVYREVR